MEQPHVTLYLTQFNDDADDELLSHIQAAVAQAQQFPVRMLNAYPSGTYGMWNVSTPAPLQALSDAIVTSTYHLVNHTMEVPAWIHNLPPAVQKEKIAMFKKYGSPNVFGSFAPHVTLCWDEKPNNVIRMIQSWRGNTYPMSVVATVAVGEVGPHGTVLRGKDIASFKIPLN